MGPGRDNAQGIPQEAMGPLADLDPGRMVGAVQQLVDSGHGLIPAQDGLIDYLAAVLVEEDGPDGAVHEERRLSMGSSGTASSHNRPVSVRR
jgi:hypothetical protein